MVSCGTVIVILSESERHSQKGMSIFDLNTDVLVFFLNVFSFYHGTVVLN